MLLTAKYVMPITAPFIEDGAVLVRDDKIVAVGTAKQLKEQFPDEEVRDFGLAALSPGFVDLHTHMRYTALRGLFEDLPYAEWKRAVLHVEPFFSKKDWEDSARLGALEAIASGITTLADITIPGSPVKALHESGLRGLVYREVMTMRPENVDEAMKEALGDIERWSDITSDTDLISYGLAGGPVYATHPKVYKAIANYVGQSDMPVAMHLAGSREEAQFIRYGSSSFSVHASQVAADLDLDLPPWLPAGVSPVRYAYNWEILNVPNIMIVHGVQCDETDIKILAQQGVSVAHCPRINAKLGMGFAPVNAMLEAGMTVGIGTDSPAAVDTTDVLDEMRVGLMINRAVNAGKHCGMTGEKMLRMGTIDAAKAIKMDHLIGSLEPGKKADIIAIDLHNSHQNPTSDPASAVIYTANQDNVKWTMVNGRVLYDDFVHVSGMPRDEIVQTAREIRSRIRHGAADEELRVKLIKRMEEDASDRLKR